MATYAVKTCNNCGIRKPQPEMHRVEKEYVTTSKNQLTGRDVAFALFSDTAARSFRKAVFSGGGRKHVRKGVVWSCGRCAGILSPEERAEVERRKQKWRESVRKNKERESANLEKMQKAKKAQLEKEIKEEKALERRLILRAKNIISSKISEDNIKLRERFQNYREKIKSNSSLTPKDLKKITEYSGVVESHIIKSFASARELSYNPSTKKVELQTSQLSKTRLMVRPKNRLLNLPWTIKWKTWLALTIAICLLDLIVPPEMQELFIFLLLIFFIISPTYLAIRRSFYKVSKSSMPALEKLSKLEESIFQDIDKQVFNANEALNLPNTESKISRTSEKAIQHPSPNKLNSIDAIDIEKSLIKDVLKRKNATDIFNLVLYLKIANIDGKKDSREIRYIKDLVSLEGADWNIGEKLAAFDVVDKILKVLKLKYSEEDSKRLVENLIELAAVDSNVDAHEENFIFLVASNLSVSLNGVTEKLTSIKGKINPALIDDIEDEDAIDVFLESLYDGD